MAIDPNILNDLITIALSVAANGLTSLIAKSTSKVVEKVVGNEVIEAEQRAKTALQPILQKALEYMAEHGLWFPSNWSEIVSLFLGTAEVEEIVRQIYSTKLTEDNELAAFPSICKIFLALFMQYTATFPSDSATHPDELAAAGSLLFDMLVEGCNLTLDSAIDKGILSAHEAKDSFRFNILQSQVKAIQKELDLLSAPYKTDRKAILEFEQQYRKQVGQRHSYITPPNLESARPRPINDLYVYPTFKRATSQDKEVDARINKDDFLAGIYRAVLLGNPGAGKSTLKLKLCYDLANNHLQRLISGRKELTPILGCHLECCVTRGSKQAGRDARQVRPLPMT